MGTRDVASFISNSALVITNTSYGEAQFSINDRSVCSVVLA